MTQMFTKCGKFTPMVYCTKKHISTNNPETHENMDKSQKHNTKQKKTSTKGYKLHDSINIDY